MDKHLKLNSIDIIKDLDKLNFEFSGKNILLTGAAGFLGCQLVHYFLYLNKTKILAEPCHLYAWDNYLRGMPDWMLGIKDNPNISIQKKEWCSDK